MDTTTVTVPKHYEFLGCLQGDLSYTEENYEVKIVVSPSGDFNVSGPYDNVLSFVEEITIDDEESVLAIMSTSW